MFTSSKGTTRETDCEELCIEDMFHHLYYSSKVHVGIDGYFFRVEVQ